MSNLWPDPVDWPPAFDDGLRWQVVETVATVLDLVGVDLTDDPELVVVEEWLSVLIAEVGDGLR